MAGKGTRRARIIGTLAAYALAGLVTKLGIAWGTGAPADWPDRAEWQPPAGRRVNAMLSAATVRVDRWSHWNSSVYTRYMVYSMWKGERYPAPPSDPSALADELRALSYREPYVSTVETPHRVDFAAWTVEFRGSPFRCVWAWVDELYPVPAGGGRPRSYFDLANTFGWVPGPNWLLPVTPVWPGLIANTAIWGLAWYALLFLPLRLLPWSAASRKRRGLCSACGYDLTGTRDRCPECGAEAVSAQAKSAASV